MRSTTDFTVWSDSSLVLVMPMNEDATQHLAAHVSAEAQWHGGSLVVEPRYAATFVEQLIADGFSVGRGGRE